MTNKRLSLLFYWYRRQKRDNILFITQKITVQQEKEIICYILRHCLCFRQSLAHRFILQNVKIKIPVIYYFWLLEFLKDRKFRVKFDYISDLFDITAGVTKVAVLSPILFSIYINDIPLWNKKNRDYGLLFADDLISLNIFKKFGNIEKHVNKYLRKLEGLRKFLFLYSYYNIIYLTKVKGTHRKIILKRFFFWIFF